MTWQASQSFAEPQYPLCVCEHSRPERSPSQNLMTSRCVSVHGVLSFARPTSCFRRRSEHAKPLASTAPLRQTKRIRRSGPRPDPDIAAPQTWIAPNIKSASSSKLPSRPRPCARNTHRKVLLYGERRETPPTHSLFSCRCCPYALDSSRSQACAVRASTVL